MNLRLFLGLPVAAVLLFGGTTSDLAAADPASASVPADNPTAEAIVQIAEVTETAAKMAAATEIVAPVEEAVPAAATVAPIVPPPPPKPRLPVSAGRRRGETETAQAVRAFGPKQIGDAAWYGGKYIGRRTTSGEVLDHVHSTAAHRTLPLNSLARVTNLDNGRSVVVKVNDRGPVSESLLIDMSPKAAEQLRMKTAGIARVMIEQVVAVPAGAR